ncbi:hypothetical protein MMC10_007053 [Thelotrema lepadinum]|nr:hypothetical protein [Thelotrema lepadinum]
MGKTQTSKASRKSKRKDVARATDKASKSPSKPDNYPYALLAEASESLQLGNPQSALPHAQQALAALTSPGPVNSIALPTLNLLGQINVELGDIDLARQAFETAVSLDPDGNLPEDEGGGAEKFLWLAQLSEEGGQDSIDWFDKGAAALERELASLQDQGVKNEELLERRAKLASSLCGMVEVWMTDLSLEPNAESACEALIARALLISDPPQPSVLQTLASIRLSQSRLEDAQSALERSLAQWKELSPTHPDMPDFPTRISLARLLMEAEMEEVALEVVERLVGEDDQSVEAWYLGGWCLWLMGSKQENTDDAEDKSALLLSSREWLRNCLKLYSLLDYEDDRLRDHAAELVHGLDNELGDAEIEEEDDDEWTDEESPDDTGGEDHEMDGT